MPPLCTAGFGLATGNLLYFLGAFYLYFINSVFISLATYIGVRMMHFQHKQFVDKAREKLVKRYIVCVTIATMCPAIYLTYGIVRETLYNTTAKNFISSELSFPETQILSREISYNKKEIKVVLLGKEVTDEQLENARHKMPNYKLSHTKLSVYQGGNNANNSIDIRNIKSMVMEDFYKNSEKQLNIQRHQIDSLQKALAEFSGAGLISTSMGQEMKVLFPEVKTISFSKGLRLNVDSVRTDTLVFAVVDYGKPLSASEKKKMEQWLRARLNNNHLKLLMD